MPKTTLRFALASSALFFLAPFATAQLRPLPGMPMVPPPVDHPGLAAQPFFQRPQPQPQPPAQPPAQPPVVGPTMEPETFGPKLEGKQLKKAVAKVKALKWHNSLLDAKALSVATGKPVLWLQALGEIDGLA